MMIFFYTSECDGENTINLIESHIENDGVSNYTCYKVLRIVDVLYDVHLHYSGKNEASVFVRIYYVFSVSN